MPFLLDDQDSISKNTTLRRLWPPGALLSPPAQAGVGGRPLLNLSFALNYAAGGLSVWGYHLVNLAIHVAAGLVLFGLLRRTFRLPGLDPHFGARADFLAFLAAAFWLWQPLQTEAVTYISQRSESLMALFYLLTLYSFLRGRLVLSWICCLLGMATKEVMVTAPAMVFLFDRTFVAGGVLEAWRRRKTYYLALAATWIPLLHLLHDIRRRSTGFSLGISPWTYALESCHALVHYLALAPWPHPLIFDYGIDVGSTGAAPWLHVLTVILLLIATFWALRRRPVLGFVCAWYVCILAPTTSFIAIAGQPWAEHRLYLPLAALIPLAVLALYRCIQGLALPALAAAALAFLACAACRNRLYADPVALWGATVRQVPSNARARVDFGDALNHAGRTADAIAQYRQAIAIAPGLPLAHDKLGKAYAAMPGFASESLAEYREALRLQPDLADAHFNLGNLYASTPGRRSEAIEEFRRALQSDPNLTEAHFDLANAYAATPGGLALAIDHYRAALAQDPGLAEAHMNLGSALSNFPKEQEKAISEYRKAIRLDPSLEDAHYDLGVLLARIPGSRREAMTEFEAALRLNPNDHQARAELDALRR